MILVSESIVEEFLNMIVRNISLGCEEGFVSYLISEIKEVTK